MTKCNELSEVVRAQSETHLDFVKVLGGDMKKGTTATSHGLGRTVEVSLGEVEVNDFGCDGSRGMRGILIRDDDVGG